MDFKVGDIVRVTNINGHAVEPYLVVVEALDNSIWPIDAKVIAGELAEMPGSYKESELELVHREDS